MGAKTPMRTGPGFCACEKGSAVRAATTQSKVLKVDSPEKALHMSNPLAKVETSHTPTEMCFFQSIQTQEESKEGIPEKITISLVRMPMDYFQTFNDLLIIDFLVGVINDCLQHVVLHITKL